MNPAEDDALVASAIAEERAKQAEKPQSLTANLMRDRNITLRKAAIHEDVVRQCHARVAAIDNFLEILKDDKEFDERMRQLWAIPQAEEETTTAMRVAQAAQQIVQMEKKAAEGKAQ